MKSKLILLLLVFSSLSIGIGVYNAQENMAEWDQFEKKFQEKTFEMSQKTGFIRNSLNSPSEKRSQETEKQKLNEQPAQKETPAEKSKSAELEKAYQPTSQDPLHHISKDIQNSPSFKKLIDFRNDELDLVLDSEDKAELAKVSRQVIQQLGNCLKSKKCLEKRAQEDPNYTLKNTRSYQLLERALHTGIILSEENPQYAESFGKDTAQNVLDIQDSDIQTLGLEILTTNDHLSDDNFNYLLEKAPHLQKESRAVLFSQTERFTRGQEQKRNRYLNELKNELKRDADSAVEILKYLQFVKLSEQELAQVSQGLCQFYSTQKSQKWKDIEYHHGLYQSAKGQQVSLKKICQN